MRIRESMWKNRVLGVVVGSIWGVSGRPGEYLGSLGEYVESIEDYLWAFGECVAVISRKCVNFRRNVADDNVDGDFPPFMRGSTLKVIV